MEWSGVGRRHPSAGVEWLGLRPTDLVIRGGDSVAVIGPSGSGKSTMLNVLGLLDRPTHGDYRCAGCDVGRLRDRQVSRLRADVLGFVFQAFHVQPHRTVRENVRVGLLSSAVPVEEWEGRVTAALHAVQLNEKRDERVGHLSGGQQQRVAIARAVVKQPRLLLADEPTGNLDSATGRLILGVLADLRGDDSAHVVVTHDRDVARTCARVIEIKDGAAREV